jgi:hypothetical protein
MTTVERRRRPGPETVWGAAFVVNRETDELVVAMEAHPVDIALDASPARSWAAASKRWRSAALDVIATLGDPAELDVNLFSAAPRSSEALAQPHF